MKKSDLKTGMRVTLRSGRIFIVLLNFQHAYDKSTDVLVSPDSSAWNLLDYYSDDLKHRDYSLDDIVKVEIPEHVYAVFGIGEKKYTTIWKRENEPKEMTIEEIQEKLGYKIKVVESR